MTGFPANTDRLLPFHKKIHIPPCDDTGNIIVIPCYHEPDILRTIESLEACHPPHNPVEIIVVVNASGKDSPGTIAVNRKTFAKLSEKAEKMNDSRIHLFPLLYEKIPARLAGAGLARRLGMDEAARRFTMCNKPGGVITSLDADTLVDPGYLEAIEKTFFEEQPDVVTVYFEHPVDESKFPSRVYRGIVQYELYLRYFVRALRVIGYPWAYHTVGSAFAVRAGAYVKEGGMNLRQAGEDFYFLQKLFKSGKVAEITSTCIYPSPRPSGRVPFGTGPEMARFLSGEKTVFDTYTPDAFLDLKSFFALAINLFDEKGRSADHVFGQIPLSLQRFLKREEFTEKISEIRRNVASSSAFVKRFYRWFDTFRVIRYLNHVHTAGIFKKLPVTDVAARLLRLQNINPGETTLQLLQQYRSLDRGEIL